MARTRKHETQSFDFCKRRTYISLEHDSKHNDNEETHFIELNMSTSKPYNLYSPRNSLCVGDPRQPIFHLPALGVTQILGMALGVMHILGFALAPQVFLDTSKILALGVLPNANPGHKRF